MTSETHVPAFETNLPSDRHRGCRHRRRPQTSVADSDPIGFALVLDGYAECLRAVGDIQAAQGIADRAATLRQQHPGEKATFTNAHLYASAGRAASQRNDWTRAARYWALAVAGGEAGSESLQFVTAAHYEYGRGLGVTGHFKDAEAELRRALELDEQNGGESYWDLTELGRLNLAQHQYAAAIPYFEREIPILDGMVAEKRNPRETAALLTDYADCLRHVGRTDDASRVSERAAAISAGAPAGAPPADRTPYGSQAGSNVSAGSQDKT